MRPIILYRDFDIESGELEAASRHFQVTDSRMDIQPGDLVVGRYAMLPFYDEQERDIQRAGATLINSYKQHRYMANLAAWYQDLVDITPKTWFYIHDVKLDDYEGPYVLKGETNSKKHMWKTHMFAKNKDEALTVMFRLQEDSLIGQQPIVIRQYVPLVQLGTGINGMPISKEFRCFFYKNQLLTSAFYWSSHVDTIENVPDPSEIPHLFLKKVSDRLMNKTNFYVVDVAQTQSGDWIVIEVNDGQQSGLSENNPDTLYANLRSALVP